MQLNIEVAEDERVVAVVIRTADGRLELREVPVPVAVSIAPLSGEPAQMPRTFLLEWVKVGPEFVEIHRGAVEESLELAHVIVPVNWPRDVEAGALVYIGPDGTLVLHEPRCVACGGKGTSPFAPPGWEGGTCGVCGGSGEYTVAAQPSSDDAALPEATPPPTGVTP